MKEVTFILGAGLGKEYGFPDGAGLRSQIEQRLEPHQRDLKFRLENNPAPTIDEFVSRNPKYTQEIRNITTQIIFEAEVEAKIRANRQNNTYFALLKIISDGQEKGFKYNIITFNYDRCLPYMINLVNQTEDSQVRHISPTSLIHVYGRLAPLWFEDQNNRRFHHHEYGGGKIPSGTNSGFYREEQLAYLCQQSQISFAKQEGLQQKPELKLVLERSGQICFLGFGYHDFNMDYLGFDFTNKNGLKEIIGTGFGLSPGNLANLKEKYPAIKEISTSSAVEFLKWEYNYQELNVDTFFDGG